MSGFRVAACQYPIEFIPDPAAWAAKLSGLAADAAGAGASLLAFPEYASLELTARLPEPVRGDLGASLEAMQAMLPEYLELHRALARRHGVHLLAGSFPVRVGDGYRNRAVLFDPEGRACWQDKLTMTRFERERWGISGGDALTLFETDLGRLGVAICYDAEFPLLVRALIEAGAETLLVPSCTDGWSGYHRVRIACQARALEGQCHVVQAVTLGEAPWSPAVDVNVGRAGIFAPPDHGLPEDGTLALGRPGQPGWILADLDPERIRAARADGQVLNHRDWNPRPPPVAAGIWRREPWRSRSAGQAIFGKDGSFSEIAYSHPQNLQYARPGTGE